MPMPCPEGFEDEYFWLRRDGYTPERIAGLWGVSMRALTKALSRRGYGVEDREPKAPLAS